MSSGWTSLRSPRRSSCCSTWPENRDCDPALTLGTGGEATRRRFSFLPICLKKLRFGAAFAAPQNARDSLFPRDSAAISSLSGQLDDVRDTFTPGAVPAPVFPQTLDAGIASGGFRP